MALHAERKGRFTASNHACALGLGYDSPQKFWRKWHDMEPITDKVHELMAWGTMNEPNAIMGYEQIVGDLVTHCQEWIAWEEWSGCTLDGRTALGILEAKCPRAMYDTPPIQYWIQVQSQLQFTDEGVADLCAWTPDECRIWRTTKSQSYWPSVESILKEYWRSLTAGLEPKRGQFKKIPLEAEWTRIA